MLPTYLATFPQYARNLPRLAALVCKKYPDASIIDVGANVGDTAALLRTSVESEIICIEGDSSYLPYLTANAEKIGRITVIPQLVGAAEGGIVVAFARKHGTSTLDGSACHNQPVAIATIDKLSKAQPNSFLRVRLVKIDTDGYDVRVMRGGRELIDRKKPVMFFELSDEALRMKGSAPEEAFTYLVELGYSIFVIYDNRGRYLCRINGQDMADFSDLNAYIYASRGSFPYCDVAAFHSQDRDIADDLVAEERLINTAS
ncbi:FkbM family methyltransferase (plasmid) [Bradyrhizobium sp. ISRA435]|nr:FkbM family methyltransferase [Bradyrhizobium sp. ISRA435]